MPQYFFNMRSEEGYEPDSDGIDLPSDNDAIREAELAAKEMVAEMVLRGGRIDGTRFEIQDESGARIGTVYLRDVVL